MNKLTDSNLETALDAAEKGIACIPCHPGTKVPMVKWKEWQTEIPTEPLLQRWFHDHRVNIARICTSIVLFDVETPDKAQLVLENCGETPYMLRSPRGVHLGYRARKGVEMHNQVKIKGEPIDVKTDGGLEMLPPSVTEKGCYAWLGSGLIANSDLPVARIGWTRERKKRQVQSIIEPLADDIMIKRAWAWAAHVEGAVSGNRGHDRFFRFVCKMLHPTPRGFGLSVDQAMPIIEAYNAQCEPPFSEKEITHKISDSVKKI